MENTNISTKNVLPDQQIIENLQCLEQETKQKISQEIDQFVNKVVNQVIKSESTVKQLANIFNNNAEITDKKKISDGTLPEKTFVTRNSYLSDLYQVKHIRTIYHIFVAVLLGQFTHKAIDDYLHNGKTALGFDRIIKSFSKLEIAIFYWVIMFVFTLACYGCFVYWAKVRSTISRKSSKLKFWDYSWLTILILSYTFYFYYISKVVAKGNFPPPTASIILAELIRLIMKMYAFLRVNVPKSLNFKFHDDKEDPCPAFSTFLYFLFAPTLVYRDNYPRTGVVRWKNVLYYAIEFLCVLYFMSFIIERYFITIFKDYGKEKIDWKQTALYVLSNAPAAGAFMICAFYILLHVWLNAWAEVLAFGDRMFYEDWWNSTSYGAYYRKWNVVVHDWLFNYIYKDMYEKVCPKNKVAAKFLVFFVSALVHEYLLSLAFGFFFPILFVEFFGLGAALVFLNLKSNGNIFFWITLPLGTCFSMCMYSIEYYVRVNCPKENETFVDFFIPRLFTCNKI